MRVLPSGSAALLVEVDTLDEVLALYPALTEERPTGVVDIVPAARTILLITDPAVADLADVERAVRQVQPRTDQRQQGELMDLPVTYAGTPRRSGRWPSAASRRGSATSRRTEATGTSRAARARAPRCQPAPLAWRESSAASTRVSHLAAGS